MMPSSPQAERSVLGSILLNESIPEVLNPSHFTLDSHRKIFHAMSELREDGLELNSLTVVEHLLSRKQLESVGGTSYIGDLTTGAMANADSSIHILLEKAQLRAIIAAAQKAIDRATSQTEKPQAITTDLETETSRIGVDTFVKEQDIFLDVSKFIRTYNQEIEWRVDGAIEVGTNGIMIGMSGDGKSPAARALAVCLAAGVPWLDMWCRRTRTALISREDYAGTTSRFIRRFIQGMGIDERGLELDKWLWISTRAQIPSLFVDNPNDLRLVINNLKKRKVEFCIMDVLNVLHSKDENDNTEMRKVLACIDKIRDECGCQVMLLHHSKKGVEDQTSMAESGRGSSAIAGFAEFKIRIRTESEDDGIKHIRFKTKAGDNHKPFHWKLTDLPVNGGVILERTEWQPNQQNKAHRSLMSV